DKIGPKVCHECGQVLGPDGLCNHDRKLEEAIKSDLEAESKTLFPDPQEDVERERLLNEAKRLANKVKMPGSERSDFWNTYVGKGVTPSKADPAALGDMVKAMKVRAGE